MNISQRLRTCARHTGLDAVIELLQEAADEIDALQARAALTQQPATGEPVYQICKKDSQCISSAWIDVEKQAYEDAGMYPEYGRRTLYTHPAPSVPDGYVLVPVEPTPEMEKAFRQAFTDQLHKRRNQWGRAKHTMSAEAAGLRAMLAAK